MGTLVSFGGRLNPLSDASSEEEGLKRPEKRSKHNRSTAFGWSAKWINSRLLKLWRKRHSLVSWAAHSVGLFGAHEKRKQWREHKICWIQLAKRLFSLRWMGGGKSYTDSPQGIISAEHFGRAWIFRLDGKWRQLCSTAAIIVGITNMLRDNRLYLCCMCACVCIYPACGWIGWEQCDS